MAGQQFITRRAEVRGDPRAIFEDIGTRVLRPEPAVERAVNTCRDATAAPEKAVRNAEKVYQIIGVQNYHLTCSISVIARMTLAMRIRICLNYW